MDTNVATSSDVPTVRNPGFSGGEHVYAEDDAVAGSNGPHQDSAQETPSSRTNTTEEKIKHADDSMELTRKKFGMDTPDNTAAGKRPKNRRAAIPPVPPLPAGAAEDLAQSKEEIPSSQDYADTEDLGNKSVIVLEDILPLVSGEEARGETATQPPLPADTVDPQGPPAPPSGSRAPSRDGRMRTSTPHQRPRHESPGTQRIRSWASSDFMKPDIRSGLVIDPSQLSHELLADAYKHEKERTERLLASLIENFQTQLAEAAKREEYEKKRGEAALADAKEEAAKARLEAANARQEAAEARREAAAQLAEANARAVTQLAEAHEQAANAGQEAATQLAEANARAVTQVAEAHEQAATRVDATRDSERQRAAEAKAESALMYEDMKSRAVAAETRLHQITDQYMSFVRP